MTQYLTANKARTFAETIWGHGGTHSSRTNRHGAFYYGCSGHGGYVVDGGVLTDDERANIDKYINPQKILIVVNGRGKTTFTQNPFRIKGQRYRYGADSVILRDYPIYFFEEDCDWSVLEKFTNIRLLERDTDPLMIDDIFNRWIVDKDA